MPKTGNESAVDVELGVEVPEVSIEGLKHLVLDAAQSVVEARGLIQEAQELGERASSPADEKAVREKRDLAARRRVPVAVLTLDLNRLLPVEGSWRDEIERQADVLQERRAAGE